MAELAGTSATRARPRERLVINNPAAYEMLEEVQRYCCVCGVTKGLQNYPVGQPLPSQGQGSSAKACGGRHRPVVSADTAGIFSGPSLPLFVASRSASNMTWSNVTSFNTTLPRQRPKTSGLKTCSQIHNILELCNFTIGTMPHVSQTCPSHIIKRARLASLSHSIP